jgi:transcriptional regulator with XRE-family HTH domain
MQASGLTIHELAEQIGISPPTVVRFRKGARRLHTATLAAILRWAREHPVPGQPSPEPAPDHPPPVSTPVDLGEAVLARLRVLAQELDEAAAVIGIDTGRLEAITFAGKPPTTEEEAAIQKWLDLPVVPHPTEPGRHVVLA